MIQRAALVLLTTLLFCGAGATAHAQSLYAGILGGYAATTSDNPLDIEPYGVGLGASAGLTLPVLPIYLGARIVYHFGQSESVSIAGARVEAESQYLLYGIDLGYDVEVGPLVLRPGLGIGRATLENSGSALVFNLSDTDSSLYLAPGVGLIFKAGLLYVGGEVRYNALTEDKHFDSLSILASLGITI